MKAPGATAIRWGRTHWGQIHWGRIHWGESRAASLVALGGLVAMLAFGLLLPVYSDEIAWRFHERAALDGGYDVWLNDICGAQTIARAPWFMMPARWFSATMNLALPSPLFVRIEGVVCALAWLALLWRLTGRIVADPGTRNAARTLALALLGLGVLPLLLVMSRPEQALILTLGAMIALALPRGGDRPDFAATPALAWLRCGAILMLATIALSYHIKGVLYAVVAAACLAVCARGPRTLAPRLVAGAVLAILTFAAFRYWSARFACPGDPVLARLLAGQNLAALLGNGGELISKLPRLVANALPILYVVPAIPSPEPISAWLPPHIFSPTLALSFRVVMFAMWAAAGGLAVFAVVRGVATRGLVRLLEPRLVIAATIVACLLVWGFSQVTKNMYEAAHVLPLSALAMVLAIGSSDAAPRRVLSALAAVALAFALLGQAVVVAALAGPFAAATASRGALPDQPLSLAVFRYGEAHGDIFRAMRAAGMPDRLERPLIDDATYMALQRSRLPLHVLGVFGPWNGSITDPADYLQRRKSSGIVALCVNLPPRFRAAAARSGEICAVGADRFDALREAAPATAG